MHGVVGWARLLALGMHTILTACELNSCLKKLQMIHTSDILHSPPECLDCVLLNMYTQVVPCYLF